MDLKKVGVTNAILWRKLETAIARTERVQFTWVKAHSGILLNECGDQLATRGVKGSSHGTIAPIPINELESQQELEMDDDDITQWDDWHVTDQLPPPACKFSISESQQRNSVRNKKGC
jgi:hypothetical protein